MQNVRRESSSTRRQRDKERRLASDGLRALVWLYYDQHRDAHEVDDGALVHLAGAGVAAGLSRAEVHVEVVGSERQINDGGGVRASDGDFHPHRRRLARPCRPARTPVRRRDHALPGSPMPELGVVAEQAVTIPVRRPARCAEVQRALPPGARRGSRTSKIATPGPTGDCRSSRSGPPDGPARPQPLPALSLTAWSATEEALG